MEISKLKKVLKGNGTFLLSTHVGPDPDALCSMVAMADCLESLGKKAHMVVEEPVPQRYVFMHGVKRIEPLARINKTFQYDAAIILDCGELSRVGKVANLIVPKKTIVNIDHHVTNDSFGTLNLVDTKASSTAEIIYTLAKALNVKMTRALASNIYIGMMTDTGSFHYDNTTSRTHAIAAELLNYDIPVYDLYKKLYEMVPLSDMKSFVKLINTFEVYGKGKVVALTLSKPMQKKFSEDFDLRDTIFKFLRSISGVEVHVILTQNTNSLTRVNLRSSGKVDVAKIAQRFDGGGHRMASGCQVALNMHKAKEKMVAAVLKSL